MKFENLKYILMICVVLTLFLRVSNALSYLRFSDSEIAYSLHNDATEKEEKKLVTEYVADEFFFVSQPHLFFVATTKLIIPAYNFCSTYFPEVSTPPPLA